MTRNWVIDSSLTMALLVINSMDHEARSALPDAPVVTGWRPGCTPGRRVRLQGWLSEVFYPAARAIEPDPHLAAKPLRRGPAAVETTTP
jgi:hypothetical protein